MLQVQGLTKDYGNAPVVRELSFTAEKGDVIGFLGLNGAGKTTTLRMLSTFLQPSSGDFFVGGVAASEFKQKIRAVIGYLPETPPLYPELTVLEYLRFVAAIKGVSSAEINSRIDEVVTRCDLQSVTGKLCGNLSKGYKQRVGIAQAVIHHPEIILLDEPTSGLDPEQLVRTRRLFRELGENSILILSTHIFSEVAQVCNRLVILHEGIVCLEQPRSVFDPTSIESLFLKAIQKESHA